MSTTQPIRSKQLLHDFKEYYLTKQSNSRNYTLILIGLTPLSASTTSFISPGEMSIAQNTAAFTPIS